MPYFWLLLLIFAFVLTKQAMENRAKQERERLRLLEEALRHGDLDQKTREELAAVLTGQARRDRNRDRQRHPAAAGAGAPGVSILHRLLAFGGWVSFCVGIAFLIAYGGHGDDEMLLTGALLSCLGFALVTYPFVIRELRAIDSDQASKRV